MLLFLATAGAVAFFVNENYFANYQNKATFNKTYFMGFAERMGLKSALKNIQTESVDDDLRNGLWNTYLMYVVNSLSHIKTYGALSQLQKYYVSLWHEYFKLPIDQVSPAENYNMEIIKKNFFKYEWFDVLGFIEFNVSEELFRTVQYNYHQYIQECNRIFEREFSGYRFIGNEIVPISNTVEVEEIKEALTVGNSTLKSTYKGVNSHLKSALTKLSDRETPDYRNSIKESISAVEVLCRHLTGKSTLGESLKSLEEKGFSINQQLKNGFEKLYAYTNSKDSGIRHGLMDNEKPTTFEEAKFMLVACSAFINFLMPQAK
jgi:AbiJ-like protein